MSDSVSTKITVDDCKAIMKKKLGATGYDLIGYDINPFSEKCGFYGDYANLIIKTKSTEGVSEHNFFVKGAPEGPSEKTAVISFNFFFKEMQFYMTLVEQMIKNNITSITDCISQCYLARLNDVLIFDNYSNKGYITLSSRLPYDYDTVVIVLKKLAKLHASALILEEQLSDAEQTYRLNIEYQQELSESCYSENENSVKHLEAALRGTMSLIDLCHEPHSEISLELFKKRAVNAFRRLRHHVKPSNRYRNTICHGDLWSNNIFLKFENGTPVDCIFVDFQATRYSPPATDVLSFLYLTTTPDFRTHHESEMLKLYHNEISRVFQHHNIGVNSVLSYEEFLKSCEDYKEFAVTQTVREFQKLMLTPQQIKELFSGDAAAMSMLSIDRSFFILKACASDPIYLEKMRTCITDLRKFCETSNVLD